MSAATTTPNPTPVLADDDLFLGDNGRVTCGKHAGCSARYSGRDLSGQKVERIDAAYMQAAGEIGWTPECEVCR